MAAGRAQTYMIDAVIQGADVKHLLACVDVDESSNTILAQHTQHLRKKKYNVNCN